MRNVGQNNGWNRKQSKVGDRITKRMGEDTMKVTAQNNEQERTVKD